MDSLNDMQEVKAHVRQSMNITQKDVWRLHDNVMARLAETQQRARRKRVMKWTTASVASAAVVALCVAVVVPMNVSPKSGSQERPAIATDEWRIFNVPEIGYNLLEGPNSHAGEGVANASKNGFATHVDKSATDQGITLTVGHVYAEKGYIAFDLVESFDSNRKEKPAFESRNLKVLIDGKPVALRHSGGDMKLSGDRYGFSYQMGTDELPELPKQFTMQVSFTNIGDVKGTWNIEFPVSLEKVEQATKTWEPGTEAVGANERLKVEKVEMTPAHLFVDFLLTVTNNEAVLHDNINNSGIEAYDDKGKWLGTHVQPTSESAEGRQVKLRGMYDTPLTQPSSLSFLPFTFVDQQVLEQSKNRVPLDSTLPVEFQLDAKKKVLVTAVEHKEGSVRLHYQASDAGFTSFFLKNYQTVIGLQSADGKEILPSSPAVPVSQDGKEFVQDFPVSAGQVKGLVLYAAPLNDYPELELFNVPLH